MERDDREMRQVLVVEELREALVHLRHPEVEDVLSTRERITRVLDIERMLRVVIDVRYRDRDLRKQTDRVGGHRQSDQEGQGCIPRIDPIGESEAADAKPLPRGRDDPACRRAQSRTRSQSRRVGLTMLHQSRTRRIFE